MREIIFRGKRKHSDGAIGKWVYGSLSVMSGGGHAFIIDHGADCIYEVEPSTVGQYTGLEDCTGVMRIFEGDVLDWTNKKGITNRAVVKFAFGRFIAKCINKSTPALLCLVNDESKVIGNVHDGVIDG